MGSVTKRRKETMCFFGYLLAFPSSRLRLSSSLSIQGVKDDMYKAEEETQIEYPKHQSIKKIDASSKYTRMHEKIDK